MDAGDAEDMVRDYWGMLGTPPTDFDTRKIGTTWIVKYRLVSVTDHRLYEAHISDKKRKMLRNGPIDLNDPSL